MASSRLNDALLQRGLKHVPALIRAENLKFLLALAVAVFLARSAYDLFLHPLSSIPGPRLAAVSQLWKRRADWKARRAHFMLKAHEKYGPVVRIAPNELSFSDPGLLQQVYGHKGYMKSDVRYLTSCHLYSRGRLMAKGADARMVHSSTLRERCTKRIISSAPATRSSMRPAASWRQRPFRHRICKNSNQS